MLIVRMVAFFIFVHATLLIPGLALADYSKLFKKKLGLKLSVSYLLTLAFFALLALLGYAFKINYDLLRVVFWLVLLASAWWVLKKRLYTEVWTLRFPIICFVAASMIACIFAGLNFKSSGTFIPDPQVLPDKNYSALNVKILNIAHTNANDNYSPYRQTQFFLNRSNPASDDFIDEWGVHFFQRTPLMGAVSATYLNALDDKIPIGYLWNADSQDASHTYDKFQIIATILNMLFIVPTYFFLVLLFKKKVGSIAVIFIALSHFYLYSAFYTWPKSLVAFFIITSWLLLAEKRIRYTVLAGVASGLAYLAHDLAVLYIAASCLYLLYQHRFKEIFILGGVSLPFALPWLYTASELYNKPSSFILYPFSINGLPQPGQKEEIINTFLHTSPIRIASIRGDTLFYLFSPYDLIYSSGGQGLVRRMWAVGIFSISGSLGLGMLIPSVVGFIKKFRSFPYWIFTIIPVIIAALIFGWVTPRSLGSLHFMQAGLAIFFGLGIAWLVDLKKTFLMLAVYVLHIANLVFFILWSFDFAVGQWLKNFSDIVGLLILAGFVVGFGYLTWAIYTNRKDRLLKLVGY